MNAKPEPKRSLISEVNHSRSDGNVCYLGLVPVALEVTARSLVEVLPSQCRDPRATPPWETVRDGCQVEKLTPGSEAGAFRFSSPMVPLGKEFADYASPEFTSGRPILEAVLGLTSRIFKDFKFDPKATEVTTHITVAWGRDFSDVSPLRGVTLGAGGQKLDVAVDVIPELDS